MSKVERGTRLRCLINEYDNMDKGETAVVDRVGDREEDSPTVVYFSNNPAYYFYLEDFEVVDDGDGEEPKVYVGYEYFKKIEEKAKKYDEIDVDDIENKRELEEIVDNLIIGKEVVKNPANFSTTVLYSLDRTILLNIFNLVSEMLDKGDLYKVEFKVRDKENG
jgi:hypothetical protein